MGSCGSDGIVYSTNGIGSFPEVPREACASLNGEDSEK